MFSAFDIAKYFLTLSDDEEGDLISNMKLQKLLYYAQGFHLAIFDAPLFDERIEAWTHGPVVPDVYHYYKQYGSGSIPFPPDFDYTKFNEPTKELLDEVYDVYGQFSASALRNISHDEPPWRDAGQSGEITHNSMKKYFQTRLV